ncbi:DsbA family protein [Sporolactobacillus sp. THM7-7]|nr:DsbA family protein [Sporolactobacillus sp. THM7-7]
MSNKRKPSSQTEKNREKVRKQRRIVVVSSFLVVFLIAAIVVMIFRDQTAGNAKPEKQQPTYRTEQTVAIQYNGQPFMGSSNAPVKIVEFADYRCPYCKQFEEKVMPRLQKDYIQTNKASFYFMNYTILGSGSLLAANAAEEVFHQNPKAFWTFHQTLFKEQGNVKKQWVTKELLTDMVKQSVPSIDVKAFQNALDTQSHKNEIDRDNQMAEDLGVPGTPTLFVNGKMVRNALDYDALKEAVDQALHEQNQN